MVGASAARTPLRLRGDNARPVGLIHPWDTPYSRATADWLRPSMTTAVMTRRAFDIHRTSVPPSYSYVLTHPIRMS